MKIKLTLTLSTFISLAGSQLLRPIRIALFAGVLMNLSACAGTLTWQEEVKLNDGRQIVVTQKRRCEGAYTGQSYASCIEREAWLTIKLPDISGQEMVWHENLKPKILNLHMGKLYVVGTPATGREYDLYGKPKPTYVGFRYEAGSWKRIAFAEIPVEIYDVNLVIDGSLVKVKFLTIDQKNSKELNGDVTYSKHNKRIDPAYKSNF